MIVAVDGPAAAGKGTIARALARQFGFHFLDTGLLYRMVGKAVLDAGRSPNDREAATEAARALDPESFRDGDLRGEEVGQAASIVAVNPQVRAALLDYQRQFARMAPGAVLDGRDIGTVVCPNADVKIYVTASPEVRAVRRQRELAERGTAVTFEDVLMEIRTRDTRDSSRAAAPLVAASDAHVLDTTNMSIGDAVAAAVKVVLPRLRGRKGPRPP
jgi:cytidylate kinase